MAATEADLAPVPRVGATRVPAIVAAGTPAQAATSPPPATPRDRTSTLQVPYRFLGRIDDAGGSVLVFYGKGRSIAVREPGPLDDQFHVDAILEHQVLIRHLPSGAARFVDLADRPARPPAPALPDSVPQD
jgi:hypothetical protein